MSATTRSRSASGSIAWPVSCGPSSPITSMWIWFLSSVNGSCSGGATARLVRDETLVQVHGCYFLLGGTDRRARGRRGRCDRLAVAGSPPVKSAGELVERGGCVGLRTGERDRDALVDRARDLAVGRDEHVGLAPEDADDVVVDDADAGVRTVEHELDLRLVVAHQLERLEPELRVLERERVEHADHHEVGARVDRGDHLGREARRGVDDHDVVLRASDREDVAERARS